MTQIANRQTNGPAIASLMKDDPGIAAMIEKTRFDTFGDSLQYGPLLYHFTSKLVEEAFKRIADYLLIPHSPQVDWTKTLLEEAPTPPVAPAAKKQYETNLAVNEMFGYHTIDLHSGGTVTVQRFNMTAGDPVEKPFGFHRDHMNVMLSILFSETPLISTLSPDDIYNAVTNQLLNVNVPTPDIAELEWVSGIPEALDVLKSSTMQLGREIPYDTLDDAPLHVKEGMITAIRNGALHALSVNRGGFIYN